MENINRLFLDKIKEARRYNKKILIETLTKNVVDFIKNKGYIIIIDEYRSIDFRDMIVKDNREPKDYITNQFKIDDVGIIKDEVVSYINKDFNTVMEYVNYVYGKPKRIFKKVVRYTIGALIIFLLLVIYLVMALIFALGGN